MAINFTRLFTALGKIVASVNSVNTYRGTTLPARTAVLDAQYVSPNQALIEGMYTQQAQAKDAESEWLGYLQTLAEDTIIQEVDLDRPMVSKTVQQALVEVANGLRAATETVTSSPTVLSSIAFPVVGNGSLLFVEGVNSNSLFYTDAYVIRCVSDQSTGATGYSELFSVQGKATVESLSELWPQGSGVFTVLQAIDTSVDTLCPSSLETWALTLVDSGANDPRGGTLGWEFTDSTSTARVTVGVLAPGSYGFAAYIDGQLSGDPGCVLRVQIVDSTGASVAGNIDTDITGSGWTLVTGSFTLPIISPYTTPSDTYALKFSIVGAGGGTVQAIVAFPGLFALTPLYPGGPSMAIVSGFTPFSLADSFTASVTRASSETESLFRGMERLFGLSGLSPTISIPVGSPGTYTNALVV